MDEPTTDPTTAPAPPTGETTVTDPLLRSTLQKVEASVPDKYRQGYDQIMAAGLQAMFSKDTYHFMEDYLKSVKKPADVPKVVAHGIIKLLTVLFQESQGKMALESSGAASVALLCHALEYVEQVLKIDVSKEMLAESTRLTNQGFLLFVKRASKLSDEDFDKVLKGKHEAGKQGAVPPEEAPPADPTAPPAQPGILQQGMA